MIHIAEMSHSFELEDGKRLTVLEDITLDVHENEFIVLLGPSGCGKTTLMRIIGGLERGFTGTVEVNGRPVRGPHLDCAVVFQDFALLPWANVLDNVAFGLQMRGMRRAASRERAQEFITKVGLAGFEQARPKELSGGMQQRVGLARALAVDAPIVLMDEPFSALDQQTRRLMQEELLAIWEADKRTVIFVTHDIEEAMLLADRIVLMSARPGQVEEIVDLEMPRPRNDFQSQHARAFAEMKERLWMQLRAMHSMAKP